MRYEATEGLGLGPLSRRGIFKIRVDGLLLQGLGFRNQNIRSQLLPNLGAEMQGFISGSRE